MREQNSGAKVLLRNYFFARNRWCRRGSFAPVACVADVNLPEPNFRKIASNPFFRKPLSPFGQGPLPLQWPEIPSRALHLLDAGPVWEATYVLCRNSTAQMSAYGISNI